MNCVKCGKPLILGLNQYYDCECINKSKEIIITAHAFGEFQFYCEKGEKLKFQYEDSEYKINWGVDIKESGEYIFTLSPNKPIQYELID